MASACGNADGPLMKIRIVVALGLAVAIAGCGSPRDKSAVMPVEKTPLENVPPNGAPFTLRLIEVVEKRAAN